MKHKPMLVTSLVLTAMLLALLTGRVAAQLQGAYILQKSVIGSTSASTQIGGIYTLSAVVGQPVLGASSGAGYNLLSGYSEPADGELLLYIPLVAR